MWNEPLPDVPSLSGHVFVIRPTHLSNSQGYTHCLDLPYSSNHAMAPRWIHPCNGGGAQWWVQGISPLTGYRYYYSDAEPQSALRVTFNPSAQDPYIVMSGGTAITASYVGP
jgi:hypothetical protein